MPATFNIPTQNVIAGQLITAVLWNGEYQNLYDNFTPAGMDDYAATDPEFQIQTDPFPSSIISKPTSLAGELERIRYEIAQLKGTTYHYQPSTLTLAQAFELYKPGMIVDYGGAAAPTGWLLCNGAAVSRTTYAALFAVISTTFGVGDGSTTFNVPDTRGRAVIGAGQGSGLTNRALAATVGAETHTLAVSEIPGNLTVSDPGHIHNQVVTPGGGTANSSLGGLGGTAVQGSNSTGAQVTGITVGGGGGAHSNMQPSIALNQIIKT